MKTLFTLQKLTRVSLACSVMLLGVGCASSGTSGGCPMRPLSCCKKKSDASGADCKTKCASEKSKDCCSK
jgi:hypothetical protein